MNTNSKLRYWFLFVILAVLTKLAIYVCDSSPMFFLDDSRAYLSTALWSQIPPDRSFTYGFLIRAVTSFGHSLQHLVLLQTILGAFSATIAAYILWDFFDVSLKWSFMAGALCVIEPLQLFYERYVMTEAVTLFVFAVFTFFVLRYIKSGRWWDVIIIQIVGLALLSLRTTYVPLIFVISLLAPILVFLRGGSVFGSSGRKRLSGVLLVAHLFVSLGSMALLHTSYKHILGNLVHTPPTYRNDSGFSLLMCWAPIVESQDFSDPAMGEKVFSLLTQDPKNRKKRGAQYCWEGGFVKVIRSIVPKRLDADIVAKKAALNAAKRDPLGLLSLYWQGYLDYWNIGYLKGVMHFDRGDTRPIPDNLQNILSKHFNLQSKQQPYMKTFTNTYFFHAWRWFLFLLLLPVFVTFHILYLRSLWPYTLIVFTFSWFLISVPATFPAVRYIHPMAWMIFIVIIPILSRLYSNLSCCRAKNSEN